MTPTVQSLVWGFVSGGALVLGAAIGWYVQVPKKVVAGVMAFGAGVLISALCFELMREAYLGAGLFPSLVGFLGGALIFASANKLLAMRGAKNRKRSGAQQPSSEEGGSGTALALGALLDGVPESIAIGLSILHGGAVSVATVAAIFLSNLPEGLSSAAGMRRSGRNATYVFTLWTVIAVACGLSSLAGYTVFGGFSPFVVAATTAVAAGAMLTMIMDTMIPEAFDEAHNWTGLIGVAGFAVSFTLSAQGGEPGAVVSGV